MWVICIKIRGYFKLFFIMVEMANLDTCLGVSLAYFHNGRDV
jgi:hypothetical protein